MVADEFIRDLTVHLSPAFLKYLFMSFRQDKSLAQVHDSAIAAGSMVARSCKSYVSVERPFRILMKFFQLMFIKVICR